jgi:DDE family transposase
VATTSKSPRAVLLAALETARRSLPEYRSKHSPKKFTQHQLFACLVLKNFLRTDYRGVVAHLRDCSSLCETVGLRHVPHFTTLQKAARRLLCAPVAKRLLDAAVRQHLGRKRKVPTVALDSTGLESSAASAYFIKRRVRTSQPWKTVVYHRYAKLGLVCDTGRHFIVSLRVGRGPRPDVDEFRLLVSDALARVRLSLVIADAGYDSEANHVFARDQHRLRTIIPAKHGRPTDKPAAGRYRRLMQRRFDQHRYGQRAQVETAISMIKRRQGAHVRGRSYPSHCRDLRLMALTHNVMILWHIRVFYRAQNILFIY